MGGWPTAALQLPRVLPEVALIGRSNVGKSSLLNALTGRRQLARVSATPGKTRACNVFLINDRYYLLDLPGYGYARVARTERQAFASLIRDVLGRPQLRGVVWLLDLRRDPSAQDQDAAQHLIARGVPVLLALTKADQVGASRRADRRATLAQALGVSTEQCILTSVKSGAGVDELRDAIAEVAA